MYARCSVSLRHSLSGRYREESTSFVFIHDHYDQLYRRLAALVLLIHAAAREQDLGFPNPSHQGIDRTVYSYSGWTKSY